MNTNIIITTCFLVSLSGCATINLGSANSVAKSGIQLASTTEDSIATIQEYVDSSLESQYLLAGLTKRDLPERTLFKDVKTRLYARKYLMNELQNTYLMFEQLINYASDENTSSAINELNNAINSYAETLGSKKVISEKTGTISSNIGGFWVKQKQSNAIKIRSKEIRESLIQIEKVLDLEIAAYSEIADANFISQAEVVKELMELKIGSPHQIIEKALGNIGVTHDRDALADTLKALSNEEEEKFNQAIENLVELRAERQAEETKASLNNLKYSIAAMIDAHQKLEDRKKLSLNELRDRIQRIRIFVDDINATQ